MTRGTIRVVCSGRLIVDPSTAEPVGEHASKVAVVAALGRIADTIDHGHWAFDLPGDSPHDDPARRAGSASHRQQGSDQPPLYLGEPTKTLLACPYKPCRLRMDRRDAALWTVLDQLDAAKIESIELRDLITVLGDLR